MNNISVKTAVAQAKELVGSRDPYRLCSALGIDLVSEAINNDGYLICSDGMKMIFVSSHVTNRHRRKFIVSHELGHFFLHQDSLYCCSNVSEVSACTSSHINTSRQETEANTFASDFLIGQGELNSQLPKRRLIFDDIIKMATHFDTSVTFTAIKAVQNSFTSDEILLCYEKSRLKWFASGDTTLRYKDIPCNFPGELRTTLLDSSVVNVWSRLYEGRVHQEIFRPYGDQRLVLLSGTRINEEDDFSEQ